MTSNISTYISLMISRITNTVDFLFSFQFFLLSSLCYRENRMVTVQSTVDTGHEDMIHDAQMDFYGTRSLIDWQGRSLTKTKQRSQSPKAIFSWGLLEKYFIVSSMSVALQYRYICYTVGRYPRQPAMPWNAAKMFRIIKFVDLILLELGMLKVPSGQIGSAWEWYHWKAL